MNNEVKADVKVNYSKKRLASIIALLIASIFFGVQYGSLISGNDLAIQTIVTVFSILAGFLIAIMTILGEPMGSIGRSWRFYEKKREAIKIRLNRHRLLFLFYILTLGVIYIYSLTKHVHPNLNYIFESIIVGLSLFCFCISMSLPWILMETQLSRFDEIIDEKLRK